MFCDAVLQTVDDLTSAPEKVINITDRWEPIDAPYVERVLICLSNLIAIIEMDIRKNIFYQGRLWPIGLLTNHWMVADLGTIRGKLL